MEYSPAYLEGGYMEVNSSDPDTQQTPHSQHNPDYETPKLPKRFSLNITGDSIEKGAIYTAKVTLCILLFLFVVAMLVASILVLVWASTEIMRMINQG